MGIYNKSFDLIVGTDIQELIDSRYSERDTVEYKRDMYHRNDSDKKELLKDISSMANAYGGFLFIGIEENDEHIPVRSVDIPNAEEERLRIEQISLSGIDPRISGIKTKVVSVGGAKIIAVRIPRSINKPHMIVSFGLNQFWIRHNLTKMPMSIHEIHDSVISSRSAWKDIMEFLARREAEVLQKYYQKGILLMRAAPAFISEDIVDIYNPMIRDFLINPPKQTKQRNLSFGIRFDVIPYPSLNGLVILWQDLKVELFRNAYYEAIFPLENFTFPLGNMKYINHRKIVTCFVDYFRAFSGLSEMIGSELPVFVAVGFYNLQQIYLEYNKLDGWGVPRKIEKLWENVNMLLPTKNYFSLSNPDDMSIYYLDKVWNAFGAERAPFFNAAGYVEEV